MLKGITKSFPCLTVSSCTLFHLIPLSTKIFCIPPSQVCCGLPLGLFPFIVACQAILGYISSPILTTYPNYLFCANSIIFLRGIIPNSMLIVWFLILSFLVFPSFLLQYLISVACSWLLQSEDKGHDSHPYVITGIYTGMLFYMPCWVLQNACSICMVTW